MDEGHHTVRENNVFLKKLGAPFCNANRPPIQGAPVSNHSTAVLVRHMIFGFCNTTNGASRRFPPRRLWTSATHRARMCNNVRHAGPFPLQIPTRRHPVGGASGVPANGQIGGRVGSPAAESVPRKRLYGHLWRGDFANFVLACRKSLAPSPDGIPTQILRNVAKCALPKHVRSYTDGLDVGRRAPI